VSEDSSSESPQVPAEEPDLGIEMLSAAHVLLSSDRAMDERDLLISTCLEALDSGPTSASALARVCNEIWPATSISEDDVLAAMQGAAELGLVAEQTTLDGIDWALARAGKDEIESTREWFANAMERLARQVQDRARDDFGELSFEVASNWARVILRLFSGEIARSATSYAGEVERGAAGSIRPMVLDGTSMLRSIDGLGMAPGTTDFLKGCLLAAVDEVDPFGNELVGQIATSCVLHAIAARRGRAAAQAALGSLQSQRVVLDTPILVDLLSSDGTEQRLRAMIQQAVSLGMEVIAPEHVLAELDDVIVRVTNEHLAGLTSGLKTGVSPWAYAQMVNEQVLELFLDGVRRKKFKTWQDFRLKVEGLKEELSSIGVIVRAHNNTSRSNVNLIDMHLTEEISKSVSGRSNKAIARDSESIELVWRARRRKVSTPSSTSLWPGGWMVSHDRHVNQAYRRANRDDREPLVLTPAQWATLMAGAAPAAEIPALVASAAAYIRQESMLRIATKYPPAIALTLARSLSGEYSSETDLRVAQLSSLGDMLEQAAAGQSRSGERLASELAGRRTNRLAAAGREQVDLVALERARLESVINKSTVVVTEEHAARIEAESRLAELQKREGLGGRRTVAAAILVGIAALAVIFAIIGFWTFVLGTVISGVAFFFLSRRWSRDSNVGFGSMLWSIVPEAVGLIDIGSRLLP
jgi:predicted nucleic acid-binding protein